MLPCAQQPRQARGTFRKQLTKPIVQVILSLSKCYFIDVEFKLTDFTSHLFDPQDIVPQLLIDHFVSMTDPSRAQTVDSDIARHCAFSLPAVALTLGRSNWPLLKDTYETLACGKASSPHP